MAIRRLEKTCPAEHCRHGYSDKQRSLYRGEQETLKDLGLTGVEMQCGYCGCLYRYKEDGDVEILGDINVLLKQAWEKEK